MFDQKFQSTLKKRVTLSGVGIHTGKRVRLELCPRPENTGIWFERVDIADSGLIRAHISSVSSTTRATSLSNDKARVTTVEHLLSALTALGIDNLLCRMDAEEIPVLDGSSLPFVKAILKTGIAKQNAPKQFLKVLKKVEVRDGDKLASIEPANALEIEYSISFPHPAIGTQSFLYSHATDFARDIAPSRTFGFMSEVERMRAMGLALGGSLENTVVLDGDTVLNPEGLRFADEFVRHKVLDAIGDLSLGEHYLIGRVELHKAGHEMQTRLIRELLNQQDAYRIVSSQNLGSLVQPQAQSAIA
jgi:UDP-3-O-[3-hydroxymyristoyl] N-acetylglucosamine deacetylase